MLFVEFRFFWFFLAVFCVYWSLRENRSRKIWLLLCSYTFYAAWDWRFLFLLMGSSALDFFVGMRLARTENPRARRGWLIMSLCANLGTIAIFKYCNFFISSAAVFLGWLGLPASLHTLNIIIPVGVSFYTFHSMSYTIDVYRGKMRAVTSFVDVACFIGFFPQMVAGPIVRAAQFLPQLQALRKFSDVDVRGALVLFLVGFVKKACIADGVAPTVDKYFDSPANYSAGSAWLAVLFYGIQIYCDFSGYTDMAIACARLLGYELTLNFNFPYLARSVAEFWHRWHFSLSSWLRDYLYIPLGGNRGNRWFVARNIMITMLLGGLWHGAAFTFVLWGAFHGAGLCLEHAFAERWEKVWKWLRWVITFHLVVFGWILFRAQSLDQAGSFISRLFAPGSATLWSAPVIAAVVVVIGLQLLPDKRVENFQFRLERMRPVVIAAGLAILILFVGATVPSQGVAPFIYFRF